MTTPEPNRFTLEEIATRWAGNSGHEYPLAIIIRMWREGKFQLEEEHRRYIPDYDPAWHTDTSGLWMTRTERDRLEQIYPELADHSGDTTGEGEPNPKQRNAYLGLIGVLAEWLSDLRVLDVDKPHAGASQIEAQAGTYGASIGKAGSIAEKLREARAHIGRGKQPNLK